MGAILMIYSANKYPIFSAAWLAAIYQMYSYECLTVQQLTDICNAHCKYATFERSESFYESVINRGRLIVCAAEYGYYTRPLVFKTNVNKSFFAKQRNTRLLRECSA